MHRLVDCYKPDCGLKIALTDAQIAKYRETHADFRCPAGHVQGYYGPNEYEKKIARLERKIDLLNDVIRWKDEALQDKDRELRSLRARLGWRNRWLAKGLVELT